MFLHLRKHLRAAIIIAPVLLSTSWAQAPATTQTESLRAELSQHSISTGKETGLTFQTTPGASCVFHPENDADTHHQLTLNADDQGVVRVHARTESVSTAPLTLLLDCKAQSGRKMQYPVTLRATTPAKLPRVVEQAAIPMGTRMEALGPEAETMSTSELVAHGFPPRPDATQAPTAYAKWKSLVSQRFTAVDGRRVARPEVRHSPTLPLPPPRVAFANSLSFGNWSGAYMTNPDAQYWDVQADWVIPSVSDVPWWLGYAAAAEWVGLDNAGNDLVQSGSDSESYSYNFWGQTWTFTNYSVWIESLPYAPYYLPNFPASPGDELSISIFLADQYGNPTFYYGNLTASDDTVWFMIYNLTQHNSYWGTIPKPAAFSGSTVDFVVEAPQVNGSITDLANFGVAGMHDAYFADSWFGYSSLDYNGSDPNVGTLNDITMVNFGTGDTLASSYIYPNFSTPGGGNVLWVWQNYY
jgi:hypothetical protein